MNGGVVPGGACRSSVCETPVICAYAICSWTFGWKKYLITDMPGQRLRFGVLHIVDGGLGVALGVGGDPIRHVLGRQSGVAPDRADDRDVDVRKDIGRRAHDAEHAEQHDQHRQHDEGVGPAQRQSYDPHDEFRRS